MIPPFDTLEHLKVLTESTENRIWSVNTDYQFIYFNHAYKNFFRIALGREPIIGEYCLPTEMPEDKRVELKEYYDRALKNEAVSVEVSVQLPTNEWRGIAITFNPIHQGNRVVGIVCVSHDITKIKKRKELLLLQNELLQEIVAISSHDTRRPLANILGIVQALHTIKIDNAEVLKYVGFLEQESKKLDIVIHKICEMVAHYDFERYIKENELG
jgi:PAS domain S-box-containing protein